jgi:hypothetical protein
VLEEPAVQAAQARMPVQAAQVAEAPVQQVAAPAVRVPRAEGALPEQLEPPAQPVALLT